jgi:hypothetical protein
MNDSENPVLADWENRSGITRTNTIWIKGEEPGQRQRRVLSSVLPSMVFWLPLRQPSSVLAFPGIALSKQQAVAPIKE